MARFRRDLSWPEFSALDAASSVAILPVAATEQHGPHLAVDVDDFINGPVLPGSAPEWT